MNFRSVVREHQPAETAPTLYHYTDAAGLQGIVESKTFWATHFEYTNDSTEVIYGISLAAKQLKRPVAQSHSPEDEYRVEEFLRGDVPNAKPSDALVQVALGTLDSQIEQKSSYEFFFACFSERQDQLSQWRAYAKDATGYAVGFSKDVLTTPFVRDQLRQDNSGDTIDLLKVIYDEQIQTAMIDTWIGHMRQWVDEMMPKLPDAERKDALIKANTRLVMTLLLLALHFKHHGFEEEDEWRLIYCKHNLDPIENPMFIPVRTRVTSVGVTPYVAIPLCRADEQLRMEHVVVGPKSGAATSATRREFGLDTFFKQLAGGKPQRGVSPSEIPYR